MYVRTAAIASAMSSTAAATVLPMPLVTSTVFVSSSPVTVNYATQDDTAKAGQDYTAANGTLTFGPGELTQTITVNIANDNIYEGVEQYKVLLSNVSGNATIGDGTGIGGINDQGGPTTPPPNPNTPPATPDDDRPAIAVSSPTVAEGSAAVFTVSLSTASSSAQAYKLALSNGTATQPQDYTQAIEVSFNNGGSWTTVVNGQVSVPAGQTSFLARVPTVDDNVTEPTETFLLTVSSDIARNGSATGTASITDNDAPPAIDLDANDSSGVVGTGFRTSYTENAAPVRLADADIKITDADSTQLTGATIKLTNAQAGDVLSVISSLPGGITATVNGGTVTLSGTASLAAYQQAIHEIGFSSTSDNPSTVDRTVEITVTDGGHNSNTALTTIQVTPVNDAPTVVSATSGFSGGSTPNPSYEDVSSGTTGHKEAVRVVYDPRQTTYETLLDTYWRNVDPVDSRGQFCDKGDEYLPVIFYHTEEQKRLAEESKEAVVRSKRFKQPITVKIEPAGVFYVAEDYHQDYYQKNPLRYKFYRYNCGRDARLARLAREGLLGAWFLRGSAVPLARLRGPLGQGSGMPGRRAVRDAAVSCITLPVHRTRAALERRVAFGAAGGARIVVCDRVTRVSHASCIRFLSFPGVAPRCAMRGAVRAA